MKEETSPPPWFERYVRLALRIEKVFQTRYKRRFIGYYYGPAAWKAEEEAAPAASPADLLSLANALSEALPAQQLEPHRAAFLAKQLLALETICRVLCGETFALEEEAQRCFDIQITWTPEAQFEQVLSLGEAMLPGQGSLFERMQALQRRYALPPEKFALLLPLLRAGLAEARRRTRALLALPDEEEATVEGVTNRPGNLAFSNYLGGYRSQIEFNQDARVPLYRLLEIMSHEGYPGHHVEAVLKERELYQERGYTEQALDLMLGPQAVISEGLGVLAPSSIFTADEEQDWLAEHVYPAAGIEPVALNWEDVRQVSELPLAVQKNAAFLLRDGRSDQEVIQYLMRYLMITEEETQPMLVYLKIPFNAARIFSYTEGKRLLQPWLAQADRRAAFARLLAQQLYPSELAEQAPSL